MSVSRKERWLIDPNDGYIYGWTQTLADNPKKKFLVDRTCTAVEAWESGKAMAGANWKHQKNLNAARRASGLVTSQAARRARAGKDPMAIPQSRTVVKEPEPEIVVPGNPLAGIPSEEAVDAPAETAPAENYTAEYQGPNEALIEVETPPADMDLEDLRDLAKALGIMRVTKMNTSTLLRKIESFRL